ncbi:HAD-IA family hydrolase [Streptomyces griseocarneus]|uniref:HAD-IA family hydrolase n=1 Tax=Streptomyces griseocarneus TaxID=51201 RepID=UPI00167C6CF8|nr:HAD-IA family hydrolase [Streptomyces griseocarneus]MBZ6475082.1 HAD-IA family hydrolase [Streptomyces griseocarneus]GHG62349.1 phosphatase [Streptomyces griseocarneus]
MRFSADALLFDSDDTIVSMRLVARGAWRQWAESYGMTIQEVMSRVPVHGRPASAIIADLMPADQVAEAVQRLEGAEVADALAGNVAPVPGAVELITSLPADRWAVVTSGARRVAEARLAQLGIHPKVLITVDDTTHHKPHPEPFLLAAERLGVDPSRCVVVEDAPAGLAAGRAAGMATIALTTTHAPEELEADAAVKDLTAVSAHVLQDGHLEITAG